MNDRHPAGDSFPADPGAEYSYAAYDTANYEQTAYGSYGTAAYATATYGDGWSAGSYDAHAATGVQDSGYHGDDPLYGPVPGSQDLGTGTYPTASYGAFGDEFHAADAYGTAAYGSTAYGAAAYGAEAYGTGAYGADAYGPDGFATEAYAAEPYGAEAYTAEPYGAPHDHGAHGYGTGAYDTTGWDLGGAEYPSAGLIPHQPGPHESEQGWSLQADTTAQWDMNGLDTGAYGVDFESGSPEAAGWDGAAYGHPQAAYEGLAYEATAYGTGSFEAAGWTDGEAVYDAPEGAPEAPDGTHGAQHDTAAPEFHEQHTAVFDPYQAPAAHPDEDTGGRFAEAYDEPVIAMGSDAESEPGATVAGPEGRGRRRSPKPRRSALLTVAAPSVAVLGVAGIAAASVMPAGDEETAQAAPDTEEVKVSPANSKLDTQLAGLREAGDDFADRASRTQERIDLKKREEAERKRRAAEAARREALRPKFALPVEGAGISAYFGQAGINWMSVHSGLDFPVSYGTPVKAATDGTVRTQWDPSYGNMIVLTAPDGTETWYCHLGSTRIRSGSVQAGTVIGYSGNSGNSTGPHLHFEVRPGGGSAIDPLTWFRSQGLEPT